MNFYCSRLNGCNSELIYLSVFSDVRAEEILSLFVALPIYWNDRRAPQQSLGICCLW